MVGISGGGATVSKLTVDADLDMGAYDLKTDDIKESTGGVGVDVDEMNIKDGAIQTIDALGGSVIPKEVSANLRNSHDAEDTQATTGASFVKKKTITFTHGIKGNVRCKFSIKTNNVSYYVDGRLYKNGVALGTDWDMHATTYEEFSEDVDVGTVAPGETLELWIKAEHGSAICTFKEFRFYYDSLGGAATGVNT